MLYARPFPNLAVETNKEEQEELGQARSRIEELEETNTNLRSESEARADEIRQLGQEGEERSKELSTLRNRLNLSQQNWTKEREDLVQRESFAREEFDSAKQAMQDWEVLAMEERSIRENLGERVAELEEQVGSLRENNQSLESERSTQSMNIDGLQRALKELQESTSCTFISTILLLTTSQPASKSSESWWRALKR